MSRPYIAITIIGLLISLLLQRADLPILARTASSDDLPTPTPPGPAISINLYASVSANGSGSANASAQLVNGQALAEITSSGAGKGAAQAQAPLCESCQTSANTIHADTAALPAKAQVLLTPTPPVVEPVKTPSSFAPVALIVTGDLVNIRTGPGLLYPILRNVTRSATITAIERSADSAWWRIGQGEWISQQFTLRADQVDPPVAPNAQVAPPFPIAALTPTTVQTAADPIYPFALELAERHTEANNVTLYSFVHEAERALDGYYLAILKDGSAAPGERQRSAAVPLGLTRPACKGVIFDADLCAQNRIYNLKQAWDTRLMFPTFSPWGQWRIQLVNEAGQPVSPPWTVDIRSGQPNLELYLRFKKQ